MLNQFITVNPSSTNKMNTAVIHNYSKIRRSLFVVPLLLLIGIVLFLYTKDALQVDRYIQIQKDCFYYFNARLSQFPCFIFNLTQLGDEIIVLSLLSIFVLYTPKVWEVLIYSSLISCIFASSLKKIFAVPRPAAVFDHHSFVIIGKILNGHNSLPSGHSITVFTLLTVILFAFMPQKLNNKIFWYLLIISAGVILVLTRVGVGAHYPLDVITGGIIGYISGILGIFINQKYNICSWFSNKRYYPLFILFFLICGISIIIKIRDDNLFIFYVALASLIISLYKIIHVYVKK